MARILIVDDDKDILEILIVCLTVDGHTTCTADSKTTLMPKLETFKPHLIFLHVMLGGDDGRIICKELKSSKYAVIPVMLYSAAPRLLNNFKEYHADQALEKPFDIAVLREKVNELITT